MKNISTALQTHLQGEVTTLATCWKLKRRDGTVMGFTEHDADITVDALVYESKAGFNASAVESNAGLSVDNLDVTGMLNSEAITENDIAAGKYDFAEIEVFMVNYLDLSQGKLILRTGWLGEVSLNKNQFVAEVRGLAQALSQKIGDVFSPTCRVNFAGSKCGLNPNDFKFSGTVTNVTDRRVFADTALTNATGYFNYGLLKFTSGANNGLEMEVKDYVKSANISLVLPVPYEIEVGDTFEIIAGCDKTISTCIGKFNNAVNFRGEPHVPGMDEILKTAGTR